MASIVGFLTAFAISILPLSNLEENQHFGFYSLAGIAIGVVLICLVFLHSATRSLIRNPDLFVPLGLYLGLTSSLYLVVGSSWRFLLGADGILTWSALTVWSVASLGFHLIAWAFVLGWVSRMTIQAARVGKVDLIDGFRGAETWLPKVIVALILVFLPLFAIVAPFTIALAFGPLIIIVGILTVLINIGTSVLLPQVVSSESWLVDSIKEGIRLSWDHKQFLWIPLTCGLLISGAVVLLAVDYTVIDPKKTVFGEYAEYETTTRKQTSKTSVNFVWVPSIAIDNEWHKELFKTIGTTSPPSIDFRISLLMLIASLIINLELVRRVWRRGAISNDADDTASQRISPGWIAVIVLLALPFEYLIKISPVADSSIDDLKESHLYFNNEGLKKELFFDVRTNETKNSTLGGILDLYFNDKRDEYIVVGPTGSVVLGKEKKELRRANFDLGDRSDGHSTYFTDVTAIDTDQDGAIEFLGIGGYPNTAFVLNEKGSVLWKHTGEELGVRKIDSRDLDGDGTNELLVADESNVEVFDLKGKPKFQRPLNGGTFDELFFLDADGDGKVEALNSNWRNQYLIGLTEETEGRQIKKPYNTVGVIEERSGSSLLFFQGNQLGLFSFDGSLRAKLSAPLSEVKDTRLFKPDDDLFKGTDYASVFRAKAVRFKPRVNGPAYLGVVAHLTTKKNYSSFMSMLYIYNEDGDLVYQESFPESPKALKAIPVDGGDALLLVEGDRVWMFRAE